MHSVCLNWGAWRSAKSQAVPWSLVKLVYNLNHLHHCWKCYLASLAFPWPAALSLIPPFSNCCTAKETRNLSWSQSLLKSLPPQIMGSDELFVHLPVCRGIPSHQQYSPFQKCGQHSFLQHPAIQSVSPRHSCRWEQRCLWWKCLHCARGLFIICVILMLKEAVFLLHSSGKWLCKCCRSTQTRDWRKQMRCCGALSSWNSMLGSTYFTAAWRKPDRKKWLASSLLPFTPPYPVSLFLHSNPLLS